MARMPDTGGSGRLACERCLAFLGPSDLHASVHAADTLLSDAESWCVTDQRIVPSGMEPTTGPKARRHAGQVGRPTSNLRGSAAPQEHAWISLQNTENPFFFTISQTHQCA